MFSLNKIDAVVQQTISENLITKEVQDSNLDIWVKLNSLKYNYVVKKLSKTGISSKKRNKSKTNSLEVV